MSQSAYNRAWDSFMNYLNLQAGGSNATRSKERIQVIEAFTAHQLWHTCATMLFDSKTAQKTLGHANLKITMDIYTHLRSEKEMDSITNYEKLINQRMLEQDDIIEQGQNKSQDEEIDNIFYFPIKKAVLLKLIPKPNSKSWKTAFSKIFGRNLRKKESPETLTASGLSSMAS